MYWIADNANGLYLLLGILAAGLIIAWWVTKRVRFLGFAGGVLVLIGLIWLLTQFVISDAQQIEMNVHAMADGLVAQDADRIFQHISRKFDYKGIDRDLLYDKVKAVVKQHRVREVKITAFRIEKLSRSDRLATASFRVSAWGQDGGDTPFLMGMEADFILEGDAWKLKTLRRFSPVGNKDQELDLPGIR